MSAPQRCCSQRQPRQDPGFWKTPFFPLYPPIWVLSPLKGGEPVPRPFPAAPSGSAQPDPSGQLPILWSCSQTLLPQVLVKAHELQFDAH